MEGSKKETSLLDVCEQTKIRQSKNRQKIVVVKFWKETTVLWRDRENGSNICNVITELVGAREKEESVRKPRLYAR